MKAVILSYVFDLTITANIGGQKRTPANTQGSGPDKTTIKLGCYFVTTHSGQLQLLLEPRVK